eukprot:TRINITY_DN3622_c0_g1_i1.p1 TRINITY_DN3622_c0_g1~~TRINITY_DN3622_c0_g1_i1.p1  ORF type:complete len:863 (+),score=327.30 TRINITY_DN3622_c0_g1_i1:40-2628(+)
MKRTRCISALPQAVYNPKYRADPRQVIDPSLYRVVMRRQWVPKKWLVGEDPWEMDLNSKKSFSKRNLADDYADKIRSCLSFAEAVPYYLELKERGIPPTTTFMNLYLASAQRYKFITDTKGRRADVWIMYRELESLGAKADINTLDLLRGTLHALCQEYCDSFADEVVQSNHAKVTAAVHKALMTVSEMTPENVQAFLRTWETNKEGAELMHNQGTKEDYDLLQLVSGMTSDPQQVMDLAKQFLTCEKDRKAATSMLEGHEQSLKDNEKGSRLSMESMRHAEQRELDADMEKARCVQNIVAMVEASKIDELAMNAFVSNLTGAEIITGSVPRSTKSGKAITELKVPLWEGNIIVKEEFKKLRETISTMRQYLVAQYNELCIEQVHRQGQASDGNRVDPALGQEIIEGVLKRFRSSLRALTLLNIYDDDRIAPLRPEIISHVSLPIELSEHSDHPDDVVTGCHMESDRSLPPEQRAGLSPKAASVALSYYQPNSIVKGTQKFTFDLMDFCRQHDLIDGTARREDDQKKDKQTDKMLMRRRKLNTSSSLRFVRQEANRRNPALQKVFSTGVERIIERGSADIATDAIYKIAELAYMQCHLWPASDLNELVLTCAVAASSSPTRLGLATLVYYNVRRFDDLVVAVRKDLGFVGSATRRPGGVKTHLAKHPVMAYADSGVGSEFYGLYFLAKPWEHEEGRQSDTEEVMKLFDRERDLMTKRWEDSVGVSREQGGTFYDPFGNEVVVTPGDVPELAARWEDRLRNLTCSPHTYDAIFKVMYDEVVNAERTRGTQGAVEINKYDFAKLVKRAVHQMEQYQVTPGSTTFSLLLGIARRFPSEFQGLEESILKKMKLAGREHWWQWFEEV